CEPTGHRWRVLDQIAAGRGLALVCVQPLLVYRAREGEGLTFDKSDPKDAVIIGRLGAGPPWYGPERAESGRSRVRALWWPRWARRRCARGGESGPGPARMRLAGGLGRCGQAVRVGDVARCGGGRAGAQRRRPGPGAPAGPGPV